MALRPPGARTEESGSLDVSYSTVYPDSLFLWQSSVPVFSLEHTTLMGQHLLVCPRLVKCSDSAFLPVSPILVFRCLYLENKVHSWILLIPLEADTWISVKCPGMVLQGRSESSGRGSYLPFSFIFKSQEGEMIVLSFLWSQEEVAGH